LNLSKKAFTFLDNINLLCYNEYILFISYMKSKPIQTYLSEKEMKMIDTIRKLDNIKSKSKAIKKAIEIYSIYLQMKRI